MAVTPKDRADSARDAWRRALELTAPIGRDMSLTFPVVIENQARRFGNATALLSRHEQWSYRALAERANRYARWAIERNIRPGEVVGLVMANCPDYLAIWLGITRVGGVVALVNTNLAGDALLHSIGIVAPAARHRRRDAGRRRRATSARGFPVHTRCWAHGEGHDDLPRIDQDIGLLPGDTLPRRERALPSLADRALYLYTSGTTGLPKAANVSHVRLMQWSHWFAGMMDDRVRATGCTIACRCITASAASSRSAPRWSAAGRW